MATEKIEIKKCLNRLYQRAEQNKNVWSEEDLRIAFIKTDIFTFLGYEDDDVRFEKAVPKKGKRTDVECLDKFGVVTFVVEFKKPSDPTDLKDYQSGLWDKYVLPLKARHGILTNGLRLILYERIGVNLHVLLDINLGEITSEDCDVIFDKLQKTPYVMEKLDEVAKHFKTFSKPMERKRLMEDLARDLFYKDFSLEKGTHFSRLVRGMIELFDHQIKKESFLSSAYDFWKRSYARKPEKVPKNWKPIMVELSLEENEENLYKFMFCLETAYALFTRLILAKTCEDYGFPNINLYRFLESDMKTREYGGEITAVGWGISLVGLIDTLRYELVESIFEEDIFYWWTDEFSLMRKDRGEFLKRQYDKVLINVSMSIRDIIYSIYTYDFSDIAGDPLGDLYQKYFDKDTRKALGEFYTPKEVVNYILDAVGYEGQFILEKRLLDPATGSGTFIVDALRRYLDASKPVAEEKGWGHVIKKLCNEFHIVAFDIHPFATIMAQIHFMLELLPYYKKALEDARKSRSRFTIKRVPVFRTDSLVDERKGQRIDVTSLAEGVMDVKLKISLPIKKEIDDKEFLEIEVTMPTSKEVWQKTDLKDIPEYFCALQAIFDTVKHLARKDKYEVDEKLLGVNFKEYLEDKDWRSLVNFFKRYANQILNTIKDLKYQFGDGRLVKSIEDVMLAGLLKNYVQYDFVVGNPPYVRVQRLSLEVKTRLKEYYETVVGKFDIYVPFIERGIRWLNNGGKIGYINPNLFFSRDYGRNLRKLIVENCEVRHIVDFGDSGVFKGVTNYPCILILRKHIPQKNTFKVATIMHPKKDILLSIKRNLIKSFFRDECYLLFEMEQSTLSDKSWKFAPKPMMKVFEKIKNSSQNKLGEITKNIYEGFITGANEVYFVEKQVAEKLQLEFALLKLVPKGRDVRRWKFSVRDRYVIYPHRSVNGKTVPISDSELKSKCPNIWKYFERHKNRLVERKYLMDAIKKGGRQEWYEVWNPRNFDWFNERKIITPNLSTKNNFAFDEEGYFLDHDCYGIILQDKSREFYLLVLALLNSTVLEFYLKQVSPYASGKYYRYMTGYLDKLPIKLPQNKKEQKIADQITSKVNQILGQVKIEQQMDAFPGQYLDGYTGIELGEIKYTFKANHKSLELFYLFNNGQKAFKVSNKLLEPIITELIDGGVSVVLGKKEEILQVETGIRAKYISIVLDGKRVKKGEKIKVLIPKDESIVKEILEKYENDKEQLEALPISKLEDEINELVYKLYRLDEKDKKVIEEFLEKILSTL